MGFLLYFMCTKNQKHVLRKNGNGEEHNIKKITRNMNTFTIE